MEIEFWYAISPNYETVHIADPKSYDLPIYCWLRMVKIGSNTTSYGNTHEIYSYDFFDTQFKKFTIEFGGWRLLNIVDPKGKNAYNSTFCEISDKYGAVQKFHYFKSLDESEFGSFNNVSIHAPHRMSGLINYIKNVLTKFENLHLYIQHIEIVELKRKINSLLSQKESLEKENAILKNALSHILGAKNANQLTKSDMENDHDMLVQVLTRYIQKLTAIHNNMTRSGINI